MLLRRRGEWLLLPCLLWHSRGLARIEFLLLGVLGGGKGRSAEPERPQPGFCRGRLTKESCRGLKQRRGGGYREGILEEGATIGLAKLHVPVLSCPRPGVDQIGRAS